MQNPGPWPQRSRLTNLGQGAGICIFTSSLGDSAEEGLWVILRFLLWGRNDPAAVPHPSQAQGPCRRRAESWARKGKCPLPSFPTCTLSPQSATCTLITPLLHALESLKRVTCCLSFCIQMQENCLLPHLQVCPYFFLVQTTFQ